MKNRFMKNYFSIKLEKRIIIKKEFQMLVANGITMASNRQPFPVAQFRFNKFTKLIHIKALAVSYQLRLMPKPLGNKSEKEVQVKIIFVVILFIIISIEIKADCESSMSFISQAKISDLVALVIIDDIVAHGYSCEIVEVIASKKSVKKNIIFIWGPSWCDIERCDIDTYKNDTLLIAVNEIKENIVCDYSEFSFTEKSGTYCTTTCGNNILKYKNEKVIGPIIKPYGNLQDENTKIYYFYPYYKEEIEYKTVKQLILN